MKRTLRVLALPAAILLLAACGSNTNTDDGPATDAPAAEAENVDDSDAWPIVEDENGNVVENPEDEPANNVPSEFPVAAATGTNETGAVFTLQAPEDVPDDVADLLRKAGMQDKDLEGIRVIPVEIDNTLGSETADIYSATAVTADGKQYELDTMMGYLQTIADGSGLADTDYDAYEALWDRADESSVDVAPTAKATDFLILEGVPDADSLSLTYFEIQPPEWGTPIALMPEE